MEEDVFRLLTKIYVEEERTRIEKNMKRKSAIRVLRKIYYELDGYFQGMLGYEYEVTAERGYLVITKENVVIAIIKVFIDLEVASRGILLYHTIKQSYWIMRIGKTLKDLSIIIFFIYLH